MLSVCKIFYNSSALTLIINLPCVQNGEHKKVEHLFGQSGLVPDLSFILRLSIVEDWLKVEIIVGQNRTQGVHNDF